VGRHATAECCRLTVGIRSVGQMPVLLAGVAVRMLVKVYKLRHVIFGWRKTTIGREPNHAEYKCQQRCQAQSAYPR